jgi:hypothetical protein
MGFLYFNSVGSGYIDEGKNFKVAAKAMMNSFISPSVSGMVALFARRKFTKEGDLKY